MLNAVQSSCLIFLKIILPSARHHTECLRYIVSLNDCNNSMRYAVLIEEEPGTYLD